MNIHEYQAKQLLAQYGVTVPAGSPCTTVAEAKAAAEKIFGAGHKLAVVKSQIHAGGRVVSTILVAAAEDIKKEFYLAVLLDRANSRPLIMASTEGGMDIEEVAEKHPEKIIREHIDPAVGMMPYQARKIAAALGLKGDAFNSGVKLLMGVYKTWWECDA